MVESRLALFVTDEFSNSYFHWIAETLTKLEALLQVKGQDFLKDYVLVVTAGLMLLI